MRVDTVPEKAMEKPTEADSWKMFDRIAFRYDLLNRILSFRQDVAWRRLIFESLPDGEGLRVLDLATGTGDVLLSLCGRGAKVGRGVGLDKSRNMLAIGLRKARKNRVAGRVDWQRGDAVALGFSDAAFDAATMAFGIRNVPDVPAALREIHRILKRGGRTLILEFSLPGNPVVRRLYLLYFRHVLPRIGGWVSGDREAYRYLNQTVEQFPYGEAFCTLMKEAGFENVEAVSLSFGIATLYRGDK